MSNGGWSRRDVLAAMAAGTVAGVLPWGARANAQGATPLLVRDVMVVDGTGAPARHADVLVVDGRIVQIGRVGRSESHGARVIAGGGRVLAPGFIDLHTPGDPLQRSYQPFLAMGVPTVVLAAVEGLQRLRKPTPA